MSSNKTHQMISKKLNENNEEVQDKENRQRSEQKVESICPRQEDFSRDSKNTTGNSSRWSQNVSNKRKASAQDCVVRIYRTSDNVPSFKSKGVPRLFRNINSDRMQNTFKRTITSPCARKPDVTVKKPRFDYPTETENSHPWMLQEDQSTTSTDYTKSDQKECTDDSIVECLDGLSTENSAGLENYGNSSDLLGDHFDEDIVNEDTKDSKKVEFKTELTTEFSNPVEGDCEHLNFDIIQNDSINNTPINSCPEKNKVQIKVAKDKNKQQPDNNQVATSGFFPSFSSTVHSCVGNKRSLSSPSVSDTKDYKPANEQLEDAKVKSLIKVLESCPEGVDLKLSIFMSACAHDPRSLQPFPEKVMVDNDINRHLLYFIAEEIPSVNMILFFLKEKEPVPLRKELLPVVDWLIRGEDPRLELLKEKEKKELLAKISDVPTEKLPSKVFRLKTKRNNEIEQFWQNVKGDHETVLAYHNCNVEQAHSVMYYGLHNHLTRNGVYGPGIYLTSNLTICLDNCLPGSTWGKSSLGTKLKLIFITEFISNHSVLSYSGHGVPFRTESINAENTTASSYYFIKKPKLVRLRYLMVYVIEPSVLPSNPFSYAPIRRKLIKYLGIFRLSLLIATIFMGATASRRKIQPTTWMVETAQNYFQKFSAELLSWPIWKYVETPYIAVPLADSVPESCSYL